MIFIILGPSGCGKGTQAGLLAEKYNLVHISTGNLLRQAYEQKTDLGLKAFEWWGKGRWAPTELVSILLKEELNKHLSGNFILEGWPRYSEQKDILGEYLTENNLKVDKVFYLDTPREISVERIRGRIKKASESGKTSRADDTEEVIKGRLDSYYETAEPILNYYRDLGVLEVIDNRPEIKEVFLDISKRVDDYIKNS